MQLILCGTTDIHHTSKQIHAHQPFKQLRSTEEWQLNRAELSSILSITVEEIHADLFASIKTALLLKINELLIHDDRKLRTAILVVMGVEVPSDNKLKDSLPWVVCNWLKTFLEIYGEKQFNYKMAVEYNLYPTSYLLYKPLKTSEFLIGRHIMISNRYRPPEIAPGNTFEQRKSSAMSIFTNSHPDYIINIGNLFHRLLSELYVSGY